jgi:hypothetical protein
VPSSSSSSCVLDSIYYCLWLLWKRNHWCFYHNDEMKRRKVALPAALLFLLKWNKLISSSLWVGAQRPFMQHHLQCLSSFTHYLFRATTVNHIVLLTESCKVSSPIVLCLKSLQIIYKFPFSTHNLVQSYNSQSHSPTNKKSYKASSPKVLSKWKFQWPLR